MEIVHLFACVSRAMSAQLLILVSVAVQVILNKKGDVYDGKKSDVWSCGVMLYVTLVGQYPFERPEDKGDPQKMHKMIRRIVSVDYKLPSRVEVSDDCKVCSKLGPVLLALAGFTQSQASRCCLMASLRFHGIPASSHRMDGQVYPWLLRSPVFR